MLVLKQTGRFRSQFGVRKCPKLPVLKQTGRYRSQFGVRKRPNLTHTSTESNHHTKNNSWSMWKHFDPCKKSQIRYQCQNSTFKKNNNFLQKANFQNSFFHIFFRAKPIATHPMCPHQISAKSVHPSLRSKRTKFGQTDRQHLSVYNRQTFASGESLDKNSKN